MRPDMTASHSGPGEPDSRRWFFSLKGVLIVIVAYVSAHLFARLGASRNLGEDDPYENILTQVLAFGYDPVQPPLYNWVLWTVQQLTGPHLISFLIIKYALLVAIACLLFVIARRILGDPVWAFMSVETIGLIYQTTWRLHEGFTHAMGTITATLATVWAFLIFLESPRTRNGVLLGCIAGLGLLTQFKFALFLVALGMAAVCQQAIRSILSENRGTLLLAVGFALLIAAPFYVWAFVGHDALAELMRPLAGQERFSHGERAFAGLKDAIIRPAACLLPLIVILVTVFPGMAPAALRLTSRPDGPGPDLVLFLGHYLLIVWGGLFAAALIFGVNNYPSHRLIPFLLIAVIWLVHLARAGCQTPKQLKLFAATVLVFVGVAFAARMLNMFALDPYCRICRWGIPYSELAKTIQDAGFRGGTIMTAEQELAGNLRRFFPSDRVVSTYRPIFDPPASPEIAAGQTVIIWSERFQPWLAHDHAAPFLRASDLARPWPVYRAEVPWQHLWRDTGYRTTTWFFMVTDGTAATRQ